jgi:hypothetical protein
MKKKAIFLMLALIMISAASVKAQVTIGSMNDPHKGAILDLSQSESKFGVLFPKVYLFNTGEFTLSVDDGVDAKGMVIYNNNASLPGGAGLYAWSGSEWKSLNAGNASCVPVTATATSLKTGINAKITITVTAGNPAFSYTWSKDGNSIRTVTNVSAASDSYTTVGAGIYTVTVTNPCTATPVSFTFEVKVDGETLVDNGNGTQTDSQGNLIVGTGEEEKTYKPVESDVPGIYLDDESGKTVYTGADGIPGTNDDDIYVETGEPLPTQKTKVSIFYPLSVLKSDTTYQLSLDYANLTDADSRNVIKYLTADPSLLTISENGLITTGTAPVNYTYVSILILLDDGTVIERRCTLMLTSAFTTEDSKVFSVTGTDDEVIVGSVKHLSSVIKAENGTANINDAYTLEYAFESGNSTTGSTLSPGGWFTAGIIPGTETIRVSATSPRAGKTFTDTFEVFIKEEPSEETAYETAFNGNWMELSAAPAYAGGNGTETAPYLISSVRQLKKLTADIVSLGTTDATYRKYFQLTADLDFEGAIVPNHLIYSFHGTFDGHGHVIKNLTQHVTNNSGCGIFGTLSYATLKNLGRTGGSITGNGNYAAGFVATVTNQSTISSCYNATPVTGARICAGIAGSMSTGTLENSYNIAPVEATDASYTHVGGLIALFGQASGFTLINSYNFGDITGNSRYIGGLIASALSAATSAPLVIRNSFNFGTVKNKENNDFVGAVLGYIANSNYNDFSLFNVRTRPSVVYKNGSTLVEPDRMIGYSSGANKTNVQAIETTNASQMSADAKYSLEYSQSPAFATELGDAFKYAPGRTPKLAWEE